MSTSETTSAGYVMLSAGRIPGITEMESEAGTDGTAFAGAETAGPLSKRKKSKNNRAATFARKEFTAFFAASLFRLSKFTIQISNP